jgi:hypothetical protein
MARPLRIEFEGAIYHLLPRGNERPVEKGICRCDAEVIP